MKFSFCRGLRGVKVDVVEEEKQFKFKIKKGVQVQDQEESVLGAPAESRPSQKLFRSDNQADAHDQANTSSCSNVQTDGIERVEISPASVVMELQDDQDEHVSSQEGTEEPQPSSPETVEVPMEPEVEMTVPLPRDDNAVRESGLVTKLLHLRCKDIPWLEETLNTQLQNHAQWTSPSIQNELLEIFADLIIELICKDVKDSGWYGIIIDETSDISRAEQVSFCFSYIANGSKKEAFVGFRATKTTDGATLYELVKTVINNLQLDLQNIVGECFDGASNMSGVNKGLSARMKECSPLAIYVHCYGHLLNLALQDTMTTVEPLRNTLGTIQSLYNFLEASPKRHALFGDIETEEGSLLKTLKSQSVTRWACRWEAVKSVDQQLERIVKALLVLSTDKDAKTYSESRSLLHGMCDFQFVLGLCVLKIILSNTSSLSAYLQGKTVDVISARRNANLTLATLRSCRNEESFTLVWKLCECIGNKMKSWISDSEFSFRDARVPRRQPSTRLQALVGETMQNVNAAAPPSKPEDYHRVNTFYTSLDKVLAEIETRFSGNDQDVLCALGDITLSDSPTSASLDRVARHYNLDRELLQADQRLFCQFKAAHVEKSIKTPAEVIEVLRKNSLYEMTPEFSKVASILAVIPATALLYLNGDFKGGEFLFANPDDSIQAKLKPECGRAVAFSAGLENLHGVAGVREGRRCALALWFTLRQKHDEQQRKDAWEIFRKAKEQKRLEKLPLFTPEVASHVEL
ncbi:hypothetical protein ACROYT_G017496 [Oculina patagonica]